MSEPRADDTLFSEEDNNPFLHTSGLVSLMASNNAERDPKAPQGKDDSSSAQSDDDSLLLYKNGDQFNAVPINYESRVTKLLAPKSSATIVISEAGKSNEGLANTSKKYIVYTIKLINGKADEEVQTRRRYSDFESLREVLTRVFPLLIIPPIPPKNYMSFGLLNGLVGLPPSENGQSARYSYINSRHLNKNRLVEHRKRLLSNFLNNCLEIPQIREMEFFAKFLDPSANWLDEIALISSQLPKSVYQLNPENGLKTDPLYAEMPLPNSDGPLGIPFLKPLSNNGKKVVQKTTQLLGAETEGSPPRENGLLEHPMKTSQFDSINKRVMENFMGLSADYAELATTMNSFSLVLAESSKTSDKAGEPVVEGMIDKIGLAFDRTYVTINTLIGDLETKFSEPLGEVVQYSTIINSVRKFHERKLKQSDAVDAEIKEKTKEVMLLKKQEAEASKAEEAMHRLVINEPEVEPKNAKGRYFPSMSSFKKITRYVSDIMDQNPEMTRKQKLTQLQARIKTLEKCHTIMMGDISYIADELDKTFKVSRLREFKLIFEILLSYNSIFVAWARKNLEIWEEVKEEIKKL